MVDGVDKLKDILKINDKYTKYASNSIQCVKENCQEILAGLPQG